MWFCSSAPILQQTRPDARPVRGQRERSSLQEAEGGDGEEGEFITDRLCVDVGAVEKQGLHF